MKEQTGKQEALPKVQQQMSDKAGKILCLAHNFKLTPERLADSVQNDSKLH